MDQLPELADILTDILLEPEFNDQQKYRQMILESKAGLEACRGPVPPGVASSVLACQGVIISGGVTVTVLKVRIHVSRCVFVCFGQSATQGKYPTTASACLWAGQGSENVGMMEPIRPFVTRQYEPFRVESKLHHTR